MALTHILFASLSLSREAAMEAAAQVLNKIVQQQDTNLLIAVHCTVNIVL